MPTKAHILIIDDEQDMCDALTDRLVDLGYMVSSVSDSTRAIEIAKEKAPDIVFLDLRMPGLDGVEILTELKKINDKLFVFVMTAYENPQVDDKIKELGVYAYVRKPFKGENILPLIEEAMKDRRQRAEGEALLS